MKKDKLYEEIKYVLGEFKTALILGGYFQRSRLDLCHYHLEELESLANTFGLEVIGKEACPIRKVDPATFFGKGKVAKLAQEAEEIGADVVILDDEISPNQQRNLERIFKRPVIDRTELILEIFSQRAHTKEAKIQIELAKSEYQLPRLKRLWTHLSRQVASGKGFLKGEGERQIEIDRRIVRRRISKLKKEIEEVQDQRGLQRRARERSGIPTFAIVGYTNVGKSTLLNALTQADVLVENKLFATLDTTTRHFNLPNHQEILLVDTVGFIRKIPHTLVAAFKSTLDEALYTDILIHLVDVNHPLAKEHAASTYEVLKELGAEGKPMITVLNKIDLVQDREVIEQFQSQYPRVVPVSATSHEGFDSLLDMMMSCLKELRVGINLRIPQKDYALVSRLMSEGHVMSRDYEGNDILLHVEVPAYLISQLKDYRADGTS